ncbi:MAG TPA: hypothetical protein VL977_00915 [Solirubrobacteraceae bacterium]|nr:hypothetical protein [Solirubrobacteraceae bacterium]
MRRLGPLLTATLVLAALAPAQALAKQKHRRHYTASAEVEKVWYECGHHNHLTTQFPLSVLQQAFAHLPTSDKEYTTCANEIQNAESQLIATNRPTPKQTAKQRAQTARTGRAKLKRARQTGGQPLDLSGHRIVAGVVNANGSVLSNLPTPLLIVLAVLLALGSIPTALRVRRVVRSRRHR